MNSTLFVHVVRPRAPRWVGTTESTEPASDSLSASLPVRGDTGTDTRQSGSVSSREDTGTDTRQSGSVSSVDICFSGSVSSVEMLQVGSVSSEEAERLCTKHGNKS